MQFLHGQVERAHVQESSAEVLSASQAAAGGAGHRQLDLLVGPPAIKRWTGALTLTDPRSGATLTMPGRAWHRRGPAGGAAVCLAVLSVRDLDRGWRVHHTPRGEP